VAEVVFTFDGYRVEDAYDEKCAEAECKAEKMVVG